MRIVDIIMKKRDGAALTEEELRFFINGSVSGDIPDYQVSAWLMAVYFQGMNAEETGLLTRLMMESGKVMDLSDLAGPLVDKHSTGGVGDKTSLILAPLAAACGAQVPMMSGRALGHTGGTLDKLESVKGYTINASQGELKRIIGRAGYAVIGQTAEVVPADRKMYALRDVTATVESIPLITASILSKKLAEGAQSLVFDVKCGSGAFMKTLKDAEILAESLVNTGKSMGRRVIALITAMEEPLGNMVGNFLEVEESWNSLQGDGPDDLMEVTLALCSRMLLTAGICRDPDEAMDMCRQKIRNGEGADRFRENMIAQGADWDWFLDHAGRWRAPFKVEFRAPREGVIHEINAFKIGMCALGLGVGRNKADDPVQPHTGLHFNKKRGDSVVNGDLLCEIFALNEKEACQALASLEEAVIISPDPMTPESLILKEVGEW
ncbi:thymidine phosphorylase [Oceanispirochaeta sp.]|jgi:pyrimidine-nucleoside phosphorylase|uniref:thymidine phosphorylase n=1 Tax=Oceanispirochaeta sp. TaxID=2035350 RepID=UPI002610EA99|nr:thymidine phosphorylase [Oceanispirochaeta sp.]MDA3956099.1 thymidine phosphorylase [Oceanispirochaeta sp.]